MEFFEKEYPESPVHISLVYKTIFDEIRRKTNYELPCTHKGDLLENKAIGASEFKNMVGVVLAGRTDNELWSDANHMLSAEGYKALKIRQMRNHWQRYVVDRMNATDESLCVLQEEVCLGLLEIESITTDMSLKELIEYVLNKIRLSSDLDWYSDLYIEASILYEVISDDSVPKTNKKLKEEAE